jgi:hypothetical protein
VQALMVVLIAAAVWTLVLVAVVALCKAAQAGDRAQASTNYNRDPLRRRRRLTARRSRRSAARVSSPIRWSG